MNEKTCQSLAALNIAWQRYARAVEQQLDTIPTEALNHDYLAAWEGLDACGIAEWMLEYDSETLTFSLSENEEYLAQARSTIDVDSEAEP